MPRVGAGPAACRRMALSRRPGAASSVFVVQHAVHAQPFRLHAVLREAQALVQARAARLPAVTLSCSWRTPRMPPAWSMAASISWRASPRRARRAPCIRSRSLRLWRIFIVLPATPVMPVSAVDEHAEHGVFDVRGDPGADIVQRERMFLFVTRSERFGRFAQGIQAQLAQGAASAGVNRRISGSGMAGCWEMGTPCGAASIGDACL